MHRNELREHFYSTYIALRIGIAILAIAFPFLLFGIGFLQGVKLQDSISAYYHINPESNLLRDFFVGLLFALGIALYLYKGFSSRENILLNLAGVFAVGVAIFPMDWPPDAAESAPEFLSLHGIFAVLAILCLAFVCIKCQKETLDHVKDEELRKRYSRMYRILGFSMIILPLASVAFSFILGLSQYVWIVETVCILVFSAYWWIKSRELAKSRADKELLMA